MSSDAFDWNTASKEELLALARCADGEVRHRACRYLWDSIRGRRWPDEEIRQLLQTLVDTIRPWADRRFLDDLYDCMLAAPPGPDLDAQAVLDAMAEEDWNVVAYLRILYQCGPSYWPILTARREDADPAVRATVEKLLPDS